MKENIILWREKIPFLSSLYEMYSKIDYKGIPLWPIMANDVYVYYKNQEQRSKINKILTIIRCLFFRDKIRVRSDDKNKIFATYFSDGF